MKKMETDVLTEKWFKACKVEDIPADGGSCIKYRQEQIAIFSFSRKGEWYAIQNQCPHKLQMVLSRGIIGDQQGEPKVACPFHKRSFSLKTGETIGSDCDKVKVYPVKIEAGNVYVDVSVLE